jgi:exosortase E/protease (VPEID-CTERM system)
LHGRLGVIAVALAAEAIALSFRVKVEPPSAHVGTAAALLEFNKLQHWIFRFAIAYASSFTILAYLARRTTALIAVPRHHRAARVLWCLGHVVILALLVGLTASASSPEFETHWLFLSVARPAVAVAAGVSLFAAMAPLSVWWTALRTTRLIWFYALLPAAGALLVIDGSQHLWTKTARLTFRLVEYLLRPVYPGVGVDVGTLTLTTPHFAVMVNEACSGLEGVGLMLVFCTAWLGYHRREFFFPQAFSILPVAVVLIFLLNAVRIAALLVIGDAGYARIASAGFHSQAGWIAFNIVAISVALVAKHSTWLNREACAAARQPAAAQAVTAQPSAAVLRGATAYLLPFLTILAVGMLTQALSSGFEALYPLKLFSALAVLWVYRAHYRDLIWRFSWRGLATGAVVFVLWVLAARFMMSPGAPVGEPDALARMPHAERLGWIACRIIAATFTVAIAEELAYRGYLLRRLVRREFESVDFQSVRWPALLSCAVLFGITHGAMWLPGILAGLAYGLLAVKTGSLGEAVAGHAMTNLLLAIYVLSIGDWRMW